jgi:hypothetical protein
MWAIPLLACAAGVVTLQAHAQESAVVVTHSVFATHKLPSSAVTSFTVACPAGQSAVSGGIFRPAEGTALLGLRPAGPGAYSFRFANSAANPDRRITVVVACRQIGKSARALAPALKVLQRKTKPFAVPAGGQKAVSLACPSRTVPAGSGEDLGAGLSVRSVAASLSGFSFLVSNNGSRRASAVFYGNCITVVRPAGARSTPLHVKLTTVSGRVQPGTSAFDYPCPRGWFALATGFTLLGPGIRVDGSAALDRGGKWWLLSNEATPTVVRFQLACGRL